MRQVRETGEPIKSVAKQIVVEEELSRNVIVFGLCEVESEDICAKVTEVFESLGEKPRVEASRLGKKSGSATRPVKVTLSSSTIVQQILYCLYLYPGFYSYTEGATWKILDLLMETLLI